MEPERKEGITRRRFLKYIGAISAGLGVGALVGSKLALPVKANAPASTTVQPDIISTYLHTGPAGAMFYTYNSDGTVATMTYGPLTVTYTYNSDKTINTVTAIDGSVTITDTYSYNADSTILGITRN